MDIKELRKKTKLSQRKFAEKFKLSVRTLQYWEQTNKTPKYILYMIKRILELEEVLDERIKSRVLQQ